MAQPVDTKQNDISRAGMKELLDIVYHLYGFDLRNYSRASLRRRVTRVLDRYGISMFTLKQQLVNDREFFQEFLNEVTVNVTEMFRDSLFYKAVSSLVMPGLSRYPDIRVWNAGCSTGEETYSFAIWLKEHGLLQRSFLYGTDINTRVVETAREGIYPASSLKAYSHNYLLAGGSGSLASYYHAAYGKAIMKDELKKRILFSVHNLADDQVFSEFQLVVCRNVLIYFEPALQKRVLELLYESLCPDGFLCLGSQEIIHDEAMRKRFRVISQKQKIFQKIQP